MEITLTPKMWPSRAVLENDLLNSISFFLRFSSSFGFIILSTYSAACKLYLKVVNSH